MSDTELLAALAALSESTKSLADEIAALTVALRGDAHSYTAPDYQVNLLDSQFGGVLERLDGVTIIKGKL